MHCPVLWEHESTKYESMMDCACVAPNEPQMIDTAFIKSKHIWITQFFSGKWLIPLRKPPPWGFTISMYYVLYLGERLTVFGWVHRGKSTAIRKTKNAGSRWRDSMNPGVCSGQTDHNLLFHKFSNVSKACFRITAATSAVFPWQISAMVSRIPIPGTSSIAIVTKASTWELSAAYGGRLFV